MPVQTIGGKDYIGVLTIPSLERETLEPTDLEGMEAGDWDMTLYTCTVGGQSRVTVRFVREEP